MHGLSQKVQKHLKAAGKIHTDSERGFIRAEVVHYDDLMECGSMTAAKEKGLVRSEGKDYVMKDGDIIEQGNHEDLLAAGGFYANLYNSQFEDVVA